MKKEINTHFKHTIWHCVRQHPEFGLRALYVVRHERELGLLLVHRPLRVPGVVAGDGGNLQRTRSGVPSFIDAQRAEDVVGIVLKEKVRHFEFFRCTNTKILSLWEERYVLLDLFLECLYPIFLWLFLNIFCSCAIAQLPQLRTIFMYTWPLKT